MVRFENVGLRYGMGQEILRDISFAYAPQTVPVSDRSVGRRQVLAAAAIFPGASADPRPDHRVRPRRRDADKDAITALRRRIGVVFQDFRLLDHLTTYQNVALPLRVQGREESDYRDEVVELLGWVGLGDRMCAAAGALRRREAACRHCSRADRRPQVLLADEPTGNVDPQLAQRLLRLFIELNKSGTSVVIATHDIALMDQYDARRLVLHDGRIHVYD